MSERTTWTASVLWLLISLVCLTLPIFVPSSPNPSDYFTDPISISTFVMTVISFPCCLLGLLFSPIIDLFAGVDPNSMQGMYLHLKITFVLGLAQWFLLVPRLVNRIAEAKQLALESAGAAVLSENNSLQENQFFSGGVRTPIERVIDDESDR